MTFRYSPALARERGAGARLLSASIQAATESQRASGFETSERDSRPRRMRPKTVLVIGSDWHMRRFIRAGLERYDYVIEEAENPAAAMGVASIIKPDLVVLDLDAPPVSWAAALGSLRAWSDAPVIVLATQVHEDSEGYLREIGVAGCLVKPIGMSELAALCEAAVRRDDNSAD
jgi:DNA-binding response OmpR family regulator